jgi:hypothetical protein
MLLLDELVVTVFCSLCRRRTMCNKQRMDLSDCFPFPETVNGRCWVFELGRRKSGRTNECRWSLIDGKVNARWYDGVL